MRLYGLISYAHACSGQCVAFSFGKWCFGPSCSSYLKYLGFLGDFMYLNSSVPFSAVVHPLSQYVLMFARRVVLTVLYVAFVGGCDCSDPFFDSLSTTLKLIQSNPMSGIERHRFQVFSSEHNFTL
jgi:hypothetical protein